MHFRRNNYISHVHLTQDRAHAHNDRITTGACQGTLDPPLSRWILLRPDDDASCHLRRRQGAHHSSEPALAADPPQQMGIRAEQPASTEEAWWRTSEQGIHSSGGAEEGCHGRVHPLGMSLLFNVDADPFHMLGPDAKGLVFRQ